MCWFCCTYFLIYTRGKKDLKKIIYYSDQKDDVVFSKKQDYKLPEDYKWDNESFAFRTISRLLYPLFVLFAFFYCPLILRERVIGKEKLPKGGGYFIYSNHTQPVGDAFTPSWILRGKRVVIPASAANLGIPVLGRLLPYLGALPVPAARSSLKQMSEFRRAIEKRVQRGDIAVIYPEAHVWPYYTEIRGFDSAAFTYPVSLKTPVYAMTSTYQKSGKREKPTITIYIDGPFYPGTDAGKRTQKEDLMKQVRETMLERSKESTYVYYQYTLRR